MLWRPAYKTLVARDQPLPALNVSPLPRVLIGAFDFRGIREMSIWRRLLEKDSPDTAWGQAFFLSGIAHSDVTMLDSLVPPSQRPHSFLVEDKGSEWRDLIDPIQPEQTFACVIKGNRARIMMKGIPTEEAWDAFLAELD